MILKLRTNVLKMHKQGIKISPHYLKIKAIKIMNRVLSQTNQILNKQTRKFAIQIKISWNKAMKMKF